MAAILSRWARMRLVVLSAAAAAVLAPAAGASNLIDRDATNVKLEVDNAGTALLTYTTGGKLKHVLAWGATNAHGPTLSAPQREFRVDYSGGWSLSHTLPLLWERFQDTCETYRGPALVWQVAACTARDGSQWAVQSWQRSLPNYGAVASDPSLDVWELRLSHWTGLLPTLTVKQDWAYRRYENLFGSLTYLGQPMYGFGTTRFGSPTDSYGALIYVDTLNSAYGPGWRRENSFVTHNPTGIFCYGLFPHKLFPAGNGQAYRATAVGPGVLPDLFWQSESIGNFSAELDAKANAERRSSFQDKLCRYN